MLSFSFYLFQPFEQIEEAFRKAASCGARELFTSLHLLKGKELGEQEKLEWIGRLARHYGGGGGSRRHPRRAFVLANRRWRCQGAQRVGDGRAAA